MYSRTLSEVSRRDPIEAEPTSPHESDEVIGFGSELFVHEDRVAEKAVQVHPGLMADARLRELARWEQAELKTQVQLLRERMRAGELSEDRVRLAACLGHQASQTALDEQELSLCTWVEQPPTLPSEGLILLAAAALSGLSKRQSPRWARITNDVAAALAEPVTQSRLESILEEHDWSRIPGPSVEIIYPLAWAAELSQSPLEEQRRILRQILQVVDRLGCWDALRAACEHSFLPWCLGLAQPMSNDERGRPSQGSTPAPALTICTADLLSKWGLEDGDLLLNYASAHGLRDRLTHGSLFELIRDLVVPQIEQKLDLERLHTHHNPVRVLSVDGALIDRLRPGESQIHLRPSLVEIPHSVVMAYLNRRKPPGDCE